MSQDLPTSGDNPYAPSPTSFPPTPRAVRLRRIPWAPTLATLFFGGIGITVFICSWGHLLLLGLSQWDGAVVAGHITDKFRSGKGNGKRNVAYAYEADGVSYTGKVRIKTDEDEKVKIGDPIQVRYWPTWPTFSSSIESPEIAETGDSLCLGLFAIFWNGLMIVIFWGWWGSLFAQRRVVRFGIPTAAVVIGKEIVRGKGGGPRVTYCFSSPDGSGNLIKRDAGMAISKSDYEALVLQQRVTVLYDPEHPEQGLIYTCSEYRIVGMADK